MLPSNSVRLEVRPGRCHVIVAVEIVQAEIQSHLDIAEERRQGCHLELQALTDAVLQRCEGQGNGASGRKGISSGLFNTRTDSGTGPRSRTLSCPQMRYASVLHREKSTRKMKKPLQGVPGVFTAACTIRKGRLPPRGSPGSRSSCRFPGRARASSHTRVPSLAGGAGRRFCP